MLSLSERDRQWIWHPYTAQKGSPVPLPVVKGEGVYLVDEAGSRYIDAISSWWVTIHGHAHPYIAQKIYEQALRLEQVIFAGFTHEPAIQLAEKLGSLLPGNFKKIFYSDNGSTAVEVAIKMAIQFWTNKGITKRKKIIAFHNSYHGDTFGTMSLSERGVFTLAFQTYPFDVVFVQTPTYENIERVLVTLQQHAEDAACFIYEPLIQGAGGMIMYEAAHLDRILKLLRQHEVICIADEVMTGFGRSGELFAGSRLANKADIICLSKGLTGGTMAMGVTACTENIHSAFVSDDRMHTFFHGHSFTANPLACAAALASLDLLLAPECLQQLKRINGQHVDFLPALHSDIHDHTFKNVRVTGTILAAEISAGKDGYLNVVGQQITREAMKHGIFIRPLGNTLYVMPPYCITREELEKVYRFIESIPSFLQ